MSKEKEIPVNSQIREISPEGVDSKGNPCQWSGFDKTKGDQGIFWGVPKNPELVKNAKRTIF